MHRAEKRENNSHSEPAYRYGLLLWCGAQMFNVRAQKLWGVVSSLPRCHKKIKKAVLSQRWPRDARYISGSNEPLRRYGHSKLSNMAACQQLGFDVTGNSAIRSADPENPTLEPNMKWIGSPVTEMAIRVSRGHMEPHFGGRGGRRGSAMAPFERAMVVSYRLSIVTVALSVAIRPPFAIVCLRPSNQQGSKFPGVPLGVDPWCLGLQRANIPG